MAKVTHQINEWKGEFGKEYTDRNSQTLEEMRSYYVSNYGVSLDQMCLPFFRYLDRSIRILEVGCNVGMQLLFLQSLGYRSLYGIEIQEYAVEKAKTLTKGTNIIQGTAFDIPFRDNYFDLVFTAGVLIHIAPSDIHLALNEIYRVTSRYIWGREYYSDHSTEVDYRGNNKLLWKADFAKVYLDQFDDLKLIKEERFKYLHNEDEDTFYLLEKNKPSFDERI